MHRKYNGLMGTILVLAVFLAFMVVHLDSATAQTPAYNLEERPQTEDELQLLLPWYLRYYQVVEGETSWNLVLPAEGGSGAYRGSGAIVLPLAGDARVDVSITVELGVQYEPTADDIARVDASGLPVYGFSFEVDEVEGMTVITAVSYIPEDVLMPTDVQSGISGNRMPAAYPYEVEQYVKIVQTVTNAAGLITTTQGAWDTMGQHEKILRMIDLANDIADNEARDRVIQDLQEIALWVFYGECLKGEITLVSILLAPETAGLSLVVGGGSYLAGKAVDWSLADRIETIRQQMINLGVNFDKPFGTVDKSLLQDLVAECQLLDKDDYTSYSWKRFTEVREKAQQVLEDTSATQYKVNEMLKFLQIVRDSMPKNESEFNAAVAVTGEKKRGIPFDLKITDAKDEYGALHHNNFSVNVTSNLEQSIVYNANASFNNGNATVPITLFTEGEHTLTITVGKVTRPRTLNVAIAVSAKSWDGAITKDDKYDFLPRTDGIRDAWIKKLSATADVITAGVMFRDASGTRQIGTIEVSARLASPLATIRLSIDSGWVFWQFRNTDSLYETWIYIDGTDQSVRLVNATDADVYITSFQFQNGGVLWVDNNQGLMFYNGASTVKLADKGNFNDPVFNNGWVVWRERPVDAVAWNASHIRLYNGVDTLNLSLMGDATNYIGHFLAATDGNRVVWKAMKYQNSSIEDLFSYDGATVRRLTTDNPGPVQHLRFWQDQVVWQHGVDELYLWNGQEKSQITESLPSENNYSTRRHWDFQQGKVVWHEHLDFDQESNTGYWEGSAGPVHLYDTISGTSGQLSWEGSADGEGWSIKNLRFDGQGLFWVTTRFLGEPEYVYQHVLKLYTWKSSQILTLDAYDDPAGYYYRSHYGSGYAAWARRKVNPEGRWWFWTVPTEGGEKRWITGMLGDAVSPYHDTDLFRYSPDMGIQMIARDNFEPDDAQLEGLTRGRVIWAGLRLPSVSELPAEGPNTSSGSIWGQCDSWREIYARSMPVSIEDFLRSALQGLPAIIGKPGDPGLNENDFNNNGVFDMDDIIYALQKASGMR